MFPTAVLGLRFRGFMVGLTMKQLKFTVNHGGFKRVKATIIRDFYWYIIGLILGSMINSPLLSPYKANINIIQSPLNR